MTSIDTSKIKEHMEVIAADGEKIGKVDHMQDGKIKLTKNDSPDGQHHLVPLEWIDHVDAHVHLNKSLKDIKASTSGGQAGAGQTDAVPDPGLRDAVPSGSGMPGGSPVNAKS
jgi:hypothetical protein